MQNSKYFKLQQTINNLVAGSTQHHLQVSVKKKLSPFFRLLQLRHHNNWKFLGLISQKSYVVFSYKHMIVKEALNQLYML